MMRKGLLCASLTCVLCVLLTVAVTGQSVNDDPVEISFAETFTTTLYHDAVSSTAIWDTAAGQLRLPAPLPQEEGVAGQMYASAFGHSAVYVPERDRVYIVGGTGGVIGVQEYAPGLTTTFRSLVQLPYRLRGASVFHAPARHRVYVLGGEQKLIFALDWERMVSETLTVQLPESLSYAAVAYVPEQDKAYLFGGIGANGASRNAILEYDLQAGTVITLPVTLSTPANRSSAVYDPQGGAVYIFGGQSFGFPLSGILKFDVVEHTLLTVGALPVACSGFGAVYVPEQRLALLFGGMDATQPLSQTVAFDATTESATLLPVLLPLPRSNTAAAYDTLRQTVYVFGGQYVFFTLGDILAFDAETHGLQEITANVGGRGGASAVHVQSTQRTYVFGGVDSSGSAMNTIVAFDERSLTTRLLTATMPISITDTCAVYDGSTRRAYVFGGATLLAAPQYSSSILRFEADTERLSVQGAVLPEPRAGLAAAYAEDERTVYLFGGVGSEGCTDQILAYHVTDDHLAVLPHRLPAPVAYAAAVYDDVARKVYLFGGWDPATLMRYLNQIVVFDVESETASVLPVKLPFMRANVAAVSIPGERAAYVIGGTYGAARHFGDVLRFDMLRGTIQRVPNMTLAVARHSAAAVYVPGQLTAYLFGGIGPSDRPLADITVLRMAYPLTATAQSLQINASGKSVAYATLGAQQLLRGGQADYFVSNNGGATWAGVQLGVRHDFGALGSDLRWRVLLGGDGSTTPYVNGLQILYGQVDLYSLSLPLVLR